MTALRRTVVACAMLGAVLAGMLATASAAAAGDGYVYAYDQTYGWTKSGDACRWYGNDTNWYDCTWYGVRKNMLNRASSLRNMGYAGGYDKVNFYWGTNLTGAWACLGVGDYWADLPLGRERFSWYGNDKRGLGESLNNNVASHKWVTRCGNP
jgi:hypothetical protein